MDILFLLVPLSVVLVLLILGVFAWALNSGQFDDIEREGARILDAQPSDGAAPPARAAGDVASPPIAAAVDRDQPAPRTRAEQSP